MERNKTIIVTGCQRGGTTMLSGIFEILGVPMLIGKGSNQTWEDTEFISLLDRGTEQDLITEVQRRNEKYPCWGFKHPYLHRHIEKIIRVFGNVHYFVVFRDPAAIALGLGCKVSNAIDKQKEVADGMKRVEYKMVSYEKALIDPRKFVQKIIESAELSVKREVFNKAVEYIQPEFGYKDLSEIL